MNDPSRRSFLESIGACAASAMLPAFASAAARRPNVIVILADDLGYGDLGCYGNESLSTPNLDALAAGGMRFTDFHSSGAVCSPTRAGLLTGRYQQRCGIPMVITAKNHRDIGLSPEEHTFAGSLKAAGCRTGIFGKWHLGYQPRFNPDKHGFDEFRGYVSGNVDYISHIDQTGVADWWNGSTLQPEEGYSTHLITRHAVRFIEENRERPFCLYVAHEAPHYPYQGPDDRADRTINGKFPGHGTRKDIQAAYREMVQEMDHGIGQIVETIDRLDLTNDTFIFFFSDNGANQHGSNGNLRGRKGTLWEGGHRVPAIAYWPGKIAPEQVCNETAISLDIFPTLLGIENATAPVGLALDGVDLAPVLFEDRPLAPRTLFWEHNQQQAVREGSWKLVVIRKQEETDIALSNLSEDPGETKNLKDIHPERVQTLVKKLAAWREDVTPVQ